MCEPPPRKPSSWRDLLRLDCSAALQDPLAVVCLSGRRETIIGSRARGRPCLFFARPKSFDSLDCIEYKGRPSTVNHHASIRLSLSKMAAKVEYKPSDEARVRDRQADLHSRYEFGGPLGVTAMMTGFPLMMCESLRAFHLFLTARELTCSLPVDERLLLDLPVVQPRPPGLACHLGL
jgi:hypothetical protein